MSRQDQTVDAGGVALQAGQDNNVVIYNGMSADQMSAIMENIAKTVAAFTDVGLDRALKRMDELRDEVLKRFAQEGKADPEAFKDPDFQYMLGDAQRAAARSGEPEICDTLVDLIARRSLETSRTRRAIVLAEAATKVANLTADEFAALSLVYVFRYTRKGVNNLSGLGTYVESTLMPFAKSVTREQSSFWHLQAQACANIEMGELDVLQAFKLNYGGVLGEGFTREQLESHLPDGKKNALDRWIMPCVNDPSKLQPGAITFEVFRDQAAPSNLTERELRNVWNLFEGTMTDIEGRITQVAPDAPLLFDVWRNTPLKNLTLTSIGIAIAHANATRLVGFDAPLEVWIK